MKKITLILTMCLFALLGNAQVLLDETFNYPNVPGPLNGQGGWIEAGPAHADGEGRTIVFPPLSYNDATGNWALSGMGNSYYMLDLLGTTDDNYVYKPFTSVAINSGVIYVSFLLNVNDKLSSTYTEIFGLADGTNAGPKVEIKKLSPSTTFSIGTTRSAPSSSAYVFGSSVYNTSTTYLIVLKYDFSNQTSYVFVNPPLGSQTEPSSYEAKDGVSATVRTQLSTMWSRNKQTKSNFFVSGVRVSTSWAAAVGLPVPVLSFPVNGAASNISNSGFIANWTPVANATGYQVNVYNGATQVTTVTVSGQTVSSAAVTGLASNTAYSYTVIALGDGLTYATSGASSPASLTTAGLSVPVVADATNISYTGFTANWNAVTSAQSYDVNLYFGTTLVSTTNVVGQSATSLVVSGLQAGTTYKYTVVAKGNVGVTSTASAYASATTKFDAVNSIMTNFSDGTWGTAVPVPATNLPSTGMFPTETINGFSITSGILYGLLSTGPKGEEHTNVIRLDKSSYGSSIVLPTVNAVARIEIHVIGSDTKVLQLKQWNSVSSTWDLVGPGNGAGTGIYTISGSLENVFVVDLQQSTPTQLRIDNGSTSSINIVQIITYPTMPTTVDLPAPLAPNAATNLIAGGFTASWTPVANASGYLITILNYGKYLHKNFTANGQATNSYNVVGLDSANVCTYQVAAIGDGIIYTNSLLSPASAPFAITSGLMGVQNPTVSAFVSIEGKNIVASEQSNIEVYNLQGSMLVKERNVNIVKTNLTSGLYIVRMTTADGRQVVQKVLLN